MVARGLVVVGVSAGVGRGWWPASSGGRRGRGVVVRWGGVVAGRSGKSIVRGLGEINESWWMILIQRLSLWCTAKACSTSQYM